jgi:hypothetical protein
MGLLSFLDKPAPTLVRLPAGSFTVDRAGSVLASTVSSSFPTQLMGAITRHVLGAFQSAAEAQLPLAELTINYPTLKITARELRGGAIMFLSPKTSSASTKTS